MEFNLLASHELTAPSVGGRASRIMLWGVVYCNDRRGNLGHYDGVGGLYSKSWRIQWEMKRKLGVYRVAM